MITVTGDAVFTHGEEEEVKELADFDEQVIDSHWNKQVIINPKPFGSAGVLMGSAPSEHAENAPETQAV